MFSSLIAASLLLATAHALPPIVGPQINTPSSLVACQPARLSWSGGVPPYFVSVIPGGEPAGVPYKQFDRMAETNLIWTVDVQPGTSVSLKVKDSTGNENYADKVTITGSDTSCFVPSPAPAPAPAPAAADPAAAPLATGFATTPSASAKPRSGASHTHHVSSAILGLGGVVTVIYTL